MLINPALILGCVILVAWGYLYRSNHPKNLPAFMASPFFKLGMFVMGVTVLIVGML